MLCSVRWRRGETGDSLYKPLLLKKEDMNKNIIEGGAGCKKGKKTEEGRCVNLATASEKEHDKRRLK